MPPATQLPASLARQADRVHEAWLLDDGQSGLRCEEAAMKRQSWDSYFLSLALAAATMGTCSRRKVGAIAVRDRRVLATGFNGTIGSGRFELPTLFEKKP